MCHLHLFITVVDHGRERGDPTCCLLFFEVHQEEETLDAEAWTSMDRIRWVSCFAHAVASFAGSKDGRCEHA